MTNNLEATITLCDHMNPGVGYQIRITRTAAPGAPVDVLFTACNPATGADLLTYEQCLDVLAMYRAAPALDDSAIRALHDLAWEHSEIPFAHMCSAALNREPWAVERVTAVLTYREYIARNYPTRVNEHLLIEIRATDTTTPGGGTRRSLDSV